MTGRDRQLREGDRGRRKGREGRRGGREWEENGRRNLAGASKGTPATQNVSTCRNPRREQNEVWRRQSLNLVS